MPVFSHVFICKITTIKAERFHFKKPEDECCQNLFLYHSKTKISVTTGLIAFQFFAAEGSAESAKSQCNSPGWRAAGI